MTNFRDLAKRTLDSVYTRLGEPATYYLLVGGMLQAGLPVTVTPTTRDIEVQRPPRGTPRSASRSRRLTMRLAARSEACA